MFIKKKKMDKQGLIATVVKPSSGGVVSATDDADSIESVSTSSSSSSTFHISSVSSVLVPVEEREQLIVATHEASGHACPDIMMADLASRGLHWPGMRADF